MHTIFSTVHTITGATAVGFLVESLLERHTSLGSNTILGVALLAVAGHAYAGMLRS